MRNINLYKIKYEEKGITIRIEESDLKKVSSLYTIKKLRYKNWKKIINLPKEKYYNFSFLLFILATIFLITNLIVRIDITTENKNLREEILLQLEEEGIKKYTLIKNEKKLQEKKETILTKEKEKLEWLNIERIGMRYIVKLQPKINKNPVIDNPYCHVIAKKEGSVSKIIANKGVELVEVNDYVREGDILISGDIIYNEETKKQVCASGRVFIKTWYTISIETTKTYEEKTPLKKYRYNIKLKHDNNTNKIFKERVENPLDKDKKMINILGYEFYLTKEYETETIIKEYDDKTLEEKINQSIDEKMATILQGEYNLIERKVLKKEENDSTINMMVFIVAEEEATKQIVPSE